MEILASLLGAVSTGGLSSILGLVGGYFTKRQEAKYQAAKDQHELNMRKLDIAESKLDRQHEINMAQADMDQVRLEGDIQADLITLQNQGKEMQEENKAFSASQVHGNTATGIMSWVRPGITLILLIEQFVLTIIVWRAVGGLDAFDQTQLNDLLIYTIKTVLFAANTAIFWWFGQKWSSSKKHL